MLAFNGDYYNYKDKYSMIIRNGVLYRDMPSTRDLLLVYNDGTMSGVLAADRQEGMGQTYIDQGVVHSFEFGPLLVLNGEKTQLPDKYIIYRSRTAYGHRPGRCQPLRGHRRGRAARRLERPRHDASGDAAGLCGPGLPHRL